MSVLRVAVDLTGLEQPVDRPLATSQQVRFVEALIQQAPELEFDVLATPGAFQELTQFEAANARRVLIADPSPLQRTLARLESRVQRRLSRSRVANGFAWTKGLRSSMEHWRQGSIARHGANVVFRPFTHFGVHDPSVPLVVAVDDLQHLSHPHLLSSAERARRASTVHPTLRSAARIVCSTRSLGEQVVQCDGVLADRVLTVPPGPLLAKSRANPPRIGQTLGRLGLEQDRYFLIVADFEQRHNHRLVLTALAMFRARNPDLDPRLVCVGGPISTAASFNDTAQEMGLGQSISFPGPLESAEIAALVAGCRGVIIPSLYETIGEMALQAISAGRPVLCSELDSLSALTAGAALTFDPHRPVALMAALEQFERDPDLRERLVRLGRERQTAMDDARTVADAYLAAFREARTACLPSR